MTSEQVDSHLEVYGKLAVEVYRTSEAIKAVEASGMMQEDITDITATMWESINGIACMQGDIESAVAHGTPLNANWFSEESK